MNRPSFMMGRVRVRDREEELPAGPHAVRWAMGRKRVVLRAQSGRRAPETKESFSKGRVVVRTFLVLTLRCGE